VTLAPPSPEGLLGLATSTSTTITPNGQHINLGLRYLLPSFKLLLPHPSSALTFITLVYHGNIHSLILPWHLVYLNTSSTPSTFSSTTLSHHVKPCFTSSSDTFRPHHHIFHLSHHYVGIHHHFTGRSCRHHFTPSAICHSLEAFKVCFFPLSVVH